MITQKTFTFDNEHVPTSIHYNLIDTIKIISHDYASVDVDNPLELARRLEVINTLAHLAANYANLDD